MVCYFQAPGRKNAHNTEVRRFCAACSLSPREMSAVQVFLASVVRFDELVTCTCERLVDSSFPCR